MKLFSWLLFPFSILYSSIMHFRNYQFDNGSRKMTNFDRVIISVGNLSVGGTGKTPFIEYLIRLLHNDNKIATISRGYGRKSHGFKMADKKDNVSTIGDEPLQLYRKYSNEIIVAVGEERILAIPSILLDYPETELFLLDDAFQHRKVGRDFNIMLSDYHRPFYEDHVLPMGRLRERKSGAKRADCIVITKCPEISEMDKANIISRVSVFAPQVPVYFSSISYLEPKSAFDEEVNEISKEIILITGLASPATFIAHVQKSYDIINHFKFRDHHNFRIEDLDKILKFINENGKKMVILTTEKDMVRILSFKDHDLFKVAPVFYIPIELSVADQIGFETALLKTIEEKKKQY